MSDREDMIKTLTDLNVLNQKAKYLKTGITLLDMFVAGKNEVSDDIGFLAGKFYSFTGPNGIGKSSLCMEISKRFCSQGMKGIYCDFENGLNEKSLKDYGLWKYCAYDVDNPRKAIEAFLKGDKNFLPINPITFNTTAQIWYTMLEKVSIKIDFGIIDSLKMMQASFVEDNIKTGLEQLPLGINARSQENFLPFMKNLFTKYEVVGLYVNQYRTKIDRYGGRLAEPQNQAFLYNMDSRMTMDKLYKGEIKMKVETGYNEKVDKVIGNWLEMELVKSRVGNSHSTIRLPIIFGKGISVIYQYADTLLNNGLYTEPARIDSATDLTKLKKELSTIGDASKVPDKVSCGMDGIYEMLRIKENFDLIEKYVYNKGLLYIEKTDTPVLKEEAED